MIKKILLKSGLGFEPGNINILVGPNNSGKTSFLEDLRYKLTQPDFGYKNIVIDEIDVDLFSAEDAKKFYVKNGKKFISPTHQQPQEAGEQHLFFKTGDGNYIQFTENQIINFLTTKNDLKYRFKLVESTRTKILDGNSRLNTFTPQSLTFVTNMDDVLSNIQKLYNSRELMNEFSRYLYESLGVYPEILATNDGMGEISLLKQPLDDNLKNSHEPVIIELLEDGKRQKDVSDGIKAFIGILLELVAGNPEILLIDELEAFLHAPLARKLGNIIAKVAKSKNKQVFITTHNTNFIMGCIDSHADFNILRLTYDNEVGKAQIIKTDEIKRTVKNPLLRSTGVFEGLFYKNVIVCEADSDRIFYQEINHRLIEFKDARAIEDCLFINARNKQTVGEITQLLRRFGIPTVSIIDFDFIKDGTVVFTKYLAQNGISEGLHSSIRDKKTKLQDLYKESEDSSKEGLKLEKIKKIVAEFNKSQTIDAAKDLKNKINRQLKSTGWIPELKEKGIDFLKEQDRDIADSLFEELNKFGLFPVTVGEVESWLPDIAGGTHGNDWLVLKLERMRDG